jgi:HK97 family phage major capsid protein
MAMNRYQALLQERADLVKEAQGIFSAAQGRDLTEAEKTRDDAIAARLEVLAGEIQREERRREHERTVATVVDPNAAAAAKSQVSLHNRAEDDAKGGFQSLAEFAQAVKHASRVGGYVDPRLQYGAAPTNYYQEGGSSGEGYMVPAAFRQEIWELVHNDEDLLAMVDPEPTSVNQVDMLADESTPWGASGVQVYWRSEASQMTSQRQKQVEPRSVVLHQLYALVTASEELLKDAPRLANRLTKKVAAGFRWKINETIMNGDGVGKPKGWMKSNALVSVAKESGQTADTVVAANVANMLARIIDPSKASWFINQDVLPQLMLMTLGNYPIWTPPASGFVNAPGGFLLGRPVRFNDHCETLGDKGDIQLVNPEGYYAATRDTGLQYASSIHLFFDYGLEAFRWEFRLGGQPFLSAPVTPAKSTKTRSHFVTLAERA